MEVPRGFPDQERVQEANATGESKKVPKNDRTALHCRAEHVQGAGEYGGQCLTATASPGNRPPAAATNAAMSQQPAAG